MPDVQEVFRMATQKVGPDPSALVRQVAAQRARMRRRKAGAFVLAAALVTAAGITAARWMLARPDRTGDRMPIVVVPPGTTPGIKRVDLETGTLTSILDTQSWANPDVSEGGSMIAYDDIPGGGHNQIHVMNADGSDVRVLTDAPAGAEDPDWAPDGEAIAYESLGGRGSGWDIFVVDVSTGRSHRLTRERGDASDPSWSPDGTRILYTVGRGNDTILRTVDVATGKMARLTARGQSAAEGSWSPGGTTIAYALDAVGGELAGPDDGRHGIWLMDQDGSDRRELLSSDAFLFRPLFSPDGTRIAYFVEDENGCCDAYLVDVATGDSTKLAEGLLFPTWLENHSLVGVTQ
jgi:Tol biopolymer transport system component